MATVVKALYDYAAPSGEGLSFSVGELLDIVERSDSGWWKGTSKTSLETGWFPASYVQEAAGGAAKAASSGGGDSSGLPPGWEAFEDAEGRTYYVNSITNTTQWEKPAGLRLPGFGGESETDFGSIQPTDDTVYEDPDGDNIYGDNDYNGGEELYGDINTLPPPPAEVLPSRPTPPMAAVKPPLQAAKPAPAVAARPGPATMPRPGPATMPRTGGPAGPGAMPRPGGPQMGGPGGPRPPGMPTGSKPALARPPTSAPPTGPPRATSMPQMSPPKPVGVPPQQNLQAARPPPPETTRGMQIVPGHSGAPLQDANYDNTRFRYVENFWTDGEDKTGFEILVLKHRNGKEVCKDMAEFMRQRAAIEEGYAKQLKKLAATQLVGMEEGLMQDVWQRMKEEVANTAAAHQTYSLSLVEDIDKSFMDFKESQKSTRKTYTAKLVDSRKHLAKHVPKVESAHDKYVHLCLECDRIDRQVSCGQQDNQSRREYNRLQDNLIKLEKKRDKAGDDYNRVLEKYNAAQAQWVSDMINGCNEFEQAERDRHSFMRNTIGRYHAHRRQVHNTTEESFKATEAGLQAADSDTVIGQWTALNYTSQVQPQQLPYPTPAEVVAAKAQS